MTFIYDRDLDMFLIDEENENLFLVDEICDRLYEE